MSSPIFWWDSPRYGRVLGVNRGIWRDMLLAEAVVFGVVYAENVYTLLAICKSAQFAQCALRLGFG